MVRKYKRKNRYCKNTKLSEKVFVSILYGYIEGYTAIETHHLIENTLEANDQVSRQAVEGIYLRLGEYLWKDYLYPKFEKLYSEYELKSECESLAHFIAYYLDMMRQAIEGEINYKEYRKDGIEIGSMETVELLIMRSNKFNGLPAKTLHYHFAYVSFIETMKGEVKKGRFSMDDLKIMQLIEFEKHPL